MTRQAAQPVLAQLDDLNLDGRTPKTAPSGVSAAYAFPDHHQLIGRKRPAPYSLLVPTRAQEFTSGKSSRGKRVHIPLWVALGGVRYDKMQFFPNTQNQVSEHAGAHGCVAAYEVAPSYRHLVGGPARPPLRLALKCVPHGPKKRAAASTWASEWRIHQFLREAAASDAVYERESKAAYDGVYENQARTLDHSMSPFVGCLGGVTGSIGRVCQVYFALELMDTDLFSMIEQSASVPDFGAWILRALLSTCQGLEAMHSCGMIYCDLKPENVLIRTHDAHAKFGDFDRSCVPGHRIGVVGGTKGYYSPERMRDSSLHTCADDVWAFGVLVLIGATTAASPYLDYTVSNVHKFSPSKYLARYARCGWAPAVVSRVGMLLDRILDVDPARRAPLALALDVLAALVAELDAPETAAASGAQPALVYATTIDLTSEEAPHQIYAVQQQQQQQPIVMVSAAASASEFPCFEHGPPKLDRLCDPAVWTSACEGEDDEESKDAYESNDEAAFPWSVSASAPYACQPSPSDRTVPSFDMYSAHHQHITPPSLVHPASHHWAPISSAPLSVSCSTSSRMSYASTGASTAVFSPKVHPSRVQFCAHPYAFLSATASSPAPGARWCSTPTYSNQSGFASGGAGSSCFAALSCTPSLPPSPSISLKRQRSIGSDIEAELAAANAAVAKRVLMGW